MGVLVGTALPRAVRTAKVTLHACVDLQACVPSQLSSLIPGQRPTQLLRHGRDRAGDGVAHGRSTLSGQCGSFLHASFLVMARHARQVQQHGETCRALHQGADRGTFKTYDEVTFPVAQHGSIGCHCRTCRCCQRYRIEKASLIGGRNGGPALKALGKEGKKPNVYLVGVAGFEPATPASRTQCSTGLSHTPTRTRLIALGFAHRKKLN